MEGTCEGRRGRGRPRKRWTQDIGEWIAVSTVEAERQALERGEFRRAVWEATFIKDPPLKKKMARGGMHNEGIPLGSKVIPILVAAPCY